ncbi:clavesin-2-like isoform X2 [Anticarsia gemmatalis]
MKTLLPQFFEKSNVRKELKDVIDIAWPVLMPTVTDDYYRIMVIKINDKKFTEKSYLEFFQYNINICEYVKARDYVNGFLIVYDFRDTSMLEILTKLNPILMQQYMTILVEGFGARLKGVHVLSESTAVELLLKMMKQFVGAKIAKRLYVHKTLEDLHMFVPKDKLPKEYGGNGRSIDKIIADWADELSTPEHEEYMKMMSKAGTDESRRCSDQFNETYMGMPGSFRNLSVD